VSVRDDHINQGARQCQILSAHLGAVSQPMPNTKAGRTWRIAQRPGLRAALQSLRRVLRCFRECCKSVGQLRSPCGENKIRDVCSVTVGIRHHLCSAHEVQTQCIRQAVAPERASSSQRLPVFGAASLSRPLMSVRWKAEVRCLSAELALLEALRPDCAGLGCGKAPQPPPYAVTGRAMNP